MFRFGDMVSDVSFLYYNTRASNAVIIVFVLIVIFVLFMEYCANDIIVWAEFEVVAGLGFLLSQQQFSTSPHSFSIILTVF